MGKTIRIFDKEISVDYTLTDFRNQCIELGIPQFKTYAKYQDDNSPFFTFGNWNDYYEVLGNKDGSKINFIRRHHRDEFNRYYQNTVYKRHFLIKLIK